MNMESIAGKFIVLEGIDRCGKSTQIDRLCKIYPEAVRMNFPDRSTEIGKLIDKYLRKEIELSREAAHLLFTANRFEVKEQIEKYLKQGKIIICDRYIDSGIAYSISNGLDKDWCEDVNAGLPKPTITFYIKINIEDAITRGGFGAERFEKQEFLQKVKDYYDSVADKFIVIDGSQDPNLVTQNILKNIL